MLLLDMMETQQEEGYMPALPIGRKRRSPIEVISDWWRDWTRNSSAFSDHTCCAEGEVERLARDMGVSASELRKLARLDPNAAALLPRRMAALDLELNEVSREEPGSYHDLQRVCAMCETHKQCARDIARDPADAAWEGYCPNVATLRALNAMPWAARREW
jgi:hypothetical protein